MASWSEVEAAAPELAARARATMDAHKHKVLATLRRDGSPRVSGIEATFTDGELWLGMIPWSRKAMDLRRDPRLALHSASVDPTEDDPSAWPGDAKVAGRAVEVDDPALLERLGGRRGGRRRPPVPGRRDRGRPHPGRHARRPPGDRGLARGRRAAPPDPRLTVLS